MTNSHSVHPNAQLLQRLYSAFAAKDAATMVACYAPDAHFADPVFDLRGPEVGAMWTMFCERGKDMKIEWRDIKADGQTGSAHWEPRYTFSVTGRPVYNRIDSAFTFRDGLIAAQRDTFDLWRWSRMALGMKGALLGWTPLVRNAIRSEARRNFDNWRARRPG
jgi:ketosteroid isomerase-like protein